MPRNNTTEPVPVTVLTGFLGSGKTTVLNRLLQAPDLADTAVIINEFGEIGLDHLLIEQAIENAVLLKNGCICCTVRGDIADTLAELWRKRDAGEIPWFRRIAIETTGLADPAPVVHTIVEATDELYRCRLDGIVTTVDAMHGVAQLTRQPEARQQVAFADRILLTKTDLAPPAPVIAAIRQLNPDAPILPITHGEVTPEHVFGLGPAPDASDARLARWLYPAPPDHHGHDHPHHDHHGHDHSGHGHHHEDMHGGITSVSLRTDRPIPLAALTIWLDSLLSLRGADILRLKGVVQLEGAPRAMVLQAVHHVLHPPVWLPQAAQPGIADSRIVVIHRGLSESGLRASFTAALAQPPCTPSCVDPAPTSGWPIPVNPVHSGRQPQG